MCQIWHVGKTLRKPPVVPELADKMLAGEVSAKETSNLCAPVHKGPAADNSNDSAQKDGTSAAVPATLAPVFESP